MKIRILILTLLLALSIPLPSAQAGIIEGAAAETQVNQWVTNNAGTHYDFESQEVFTYLTNDLSGVTFKSSMDTYGNPLDLPVYVNYFNGAASGNHFIVGIPYAGGHDNGTVVYQMVFDTPQLYAGVARQWALDLTITTFYFENADPVSYTPTTPPNHGWGRDFIGYFADDANHLITKIVCDGIATYPYQPDQPMRNVWYTDDLYFGTSNSAVPLPPSILLLGSGLLGLVGWRRLRKR